MAGTRGFKRVQAVQDLAKPEMVSQLEQLAAIQLSDAKIAAICGVSVVSLQRFFKKNPQVCDAISAARASGIAHAASALYRSVAEGDHNSIKYTLMTKGGEDWNPVARVKIEGSEQLQKLMSMSPKQKLAYLEEQVQALREIIDAEENDS